MQLPTITKSQSRIINYLSSFRFLTINHLQQLFNHKDPHRIKEWLTDLSKKKYIAIIKEPKDKTKPYIICLVQKASHLLKTNDDVDLNFLNRLYKEKKSSEDFIRRLLFIASCFIFFLKHKDKAAQLNFFTEQDLQGYDYFPDPLPDAYIDQQSGKQHTRYFFDYFDSRVTDGKARFRTKYYFRYAENGDWQENTDNAPLPTILFIFESTRQKKHIYHYAKALLEKSLNHEVEIFLTMKDKILKSSDNEAIWERVESED